MRGRGHGRARRAHIGVSDAEVWSGPYGQQSLLFCGTTASLRVVAVEGVVEARGDELRHQLRRIWRSGLAA